MKLPLLDHNYAFVEAENKKDSKLVAFPLFPSWYMFLLEILIGLLGLSLCEVSCDCSGTPHLILREDRGNLFLQQSSLLIENLLPEFDFSAILFARLFYFLVHFLVMESAGQVFMCALGIQRV